MDKRYFWIIWNYNGTSTSWWICWMIPRMRRGKQSHVNFNWFIVFYGMLLLFIDRLESKKFFTLFAPFFTFFWIWFLDFSSFLLFSARHPFRFLTSWHDHDFKCVTSSPLMMCVPVDTFLKCNPENDPNWPSSLDLRIESFCPFFVLMPLMVFFVLYVLLCRFWHEIFKTHRKHL